MSISVPTSESSSHTTYNLLVILIMLNNHTDQNTNRSHPRPHPLYSAGSEAKQIALQRIAAYSHMQHQLVLRATSPHPPPRLSSPGNVASPCPSQQFVPTINLSSGSSASHEITSSLYEDLVISTQRPAYFPRSPQQASTESKRQRGPLQPLRLLMRCINQTGDQGSGRERDVTSQGRPLAEEARRAPTRCHDLSSDESIAM